MLAFSSPAFPSPYAHHSLHWLLGRVATAPSELQSETWRGQRGTQGSVLGTLGDVPGHLLLGITRQEGEGQTVPCTGTVALAVMCGVNCVWTCCDRNGNSCYSCDPISSSGVVSDRLRRPRKGERQRDATPHL